MPELRLNQVAAQTQTFSPQMQQALAILQAPALELRTLLQQEITQNPVLEEASPPSLEDGEINEETDSLPDWETRHTSSSVDPETRRQHFFDSLTEPETLGKHLLQQLRLNTSNPTLIQLGEIIIGNLDPDGFLRIALDEIATQAHVDLAKVQAALSLIQSFYPSGVGARDLKECLLLQIERLGKKNSLAYQLVENHLENLAHHRYDLLAKSLKVSLELIQEAATFISTLEPKPGRAFLSEERHQIILSELAIRKVKEGWKAFLNPVAIPHVKINDTYKDMLATAENKSEVRNYLREKIRSGRSLIQALEQRQSTLLKIVRVLIEKQKEFLVKGIASLKPLTLSQVAQEIGMHETTVSRAIAQKYIQTPWGIYEMKFFFTSGYENRASGETVSNQSIKETLRHLIDQEDRRHPYSDEDIIKIFSERGIKIARRTIAKYRSELKILPSSLRRVG